MEEAQAIAVEYIQSLDNLPAEVQHLLAEIRDKENKIAEIQSRIHPKMATYLRQASRTGSSSSSFNNSNNNLPSTKDSPPQRHLIAEDHAKITALADEKLACAERIVQLLTRAIGRLDVDLARALDRSGDSVGGGLAGFGSVGMGMGMGLGLGLGLGGDINMGGMGMGMGGGMGGGNGGGNGAGGGLGSGGLNARVSAIERLPESLRSALSAQGLDVMTGGGGALGLSLGGTSTPHPPLKRRRMNSMTSSPAAATFESHTPGRSRLTASHTRQGSPMPRSRRATSELMKDVDAEGEDDEEEGEDPSGDPEDKTLYCTCRSLSYGKMVGCDNDSCPYQWFHLTCVGLQDPLPKQWFCPECVAKHGAALTSSTSQPAGNSGAERRRKRK